jgi:hypothetical protein
MPEISTENCWPWPGFTRKSDGRATVRGKYVYRMLYLAATGEELPESGHHKCENKWCINPWHLEPLSQSDHMKEHGFGGDWGQAEKTHCANDHEYTVENTYTYKTKDGSTERHCRICRRAAKARYRAGGGKN